MAEEFVRYSENIEKKEENEDQVIRSLSESIGRQNKTTCSHYRHAVRGAHAKSHAILKGTMTINLGLPEAYRQGLFASETTFDIVVRLSTAPGDILPDSVSTGRGYALKVMGVENAQMLPGHEGQTTQDFLFASGLNFITPNIAKFLSQQELLEKSVDYLVRSKEITSLAARAANATLGLVGIESGQLGFIGHPPTHILAEEYGSQAAIRFGDYVAKLAIRPASENLKALKDVKHHIHTDFSAIQNEVQEFFKTETVEYDLYVQLCKSAETMPVEDPSVEWSEKESPYVPVARLIFKPQDSYSAARRVFGDDSLSFSPWHGRLDHQPLGRINRARKKVYPTSSDYRHEQNARVKVEPRSGAEIPD